MKRLQGRNLDIVEYPLYAVACTDVFVYVGGGGGAGKTGVGNFVSTYDIRSRSSISCLSTESHAVMDLDVCKRNAFIAMGADNFLYLGPANQQKLSVASKFVLPKTTEDSYVKYVRWSLDSQYIAVVMSDLQLHIYRFQDGSVKHVSTITFDEHIEDIDWHSNNNILVVTSNTLGLYDIFTKKQEMKYPPPPKNFFYRGAKYTSKYTDLCTIVTHEQRTLTKAIIYSSQDDPQPFRVTLDMRLAQYPCTYNAIHPSRELMAVGFSDGSCIILDLLSSVTYKSNDLHTFPITSLAFSRDALYSVSPDCRVCQYDLNFAQFDYQSFHFTLFITFIALLISLLWVFYFQN